MIRDKKENVVSDGDALKLAANNLRLARPSFLNMPPGAIPLSQSKSSLSQSRDSLQGLQAPKPAQSSTAAITPGTSPNPSPCQMLELLGCLSICSAPSCFTDIKAPSAGNGLWLYGLGLKSLCRTDAKFFAA